jgi:hypothetical protein
MGPARENDVPGIRCLHRLCGEGQTSYYFEETINYRRRHIETASVTESKAKLRRDFLYSWSVVHILKLYYILI